MSEHSSRLRAIHVLADLVQTGVPPEQHDEAAELLVTCLYTLGVSRDEIQTAMRFAIMTNHADDGGGS